MENNIATSKGYKTTVSVKWSGNCRFNEPFDRYGGVFLRFGCPENYGPALRGLPELSGDTNTNEFILVQNSISFRKILVIRGRYLSTSRNLKARLYITVSRPRIETVTRILYGTVYTLSVAWVISQSDVFWSRLMTTDIFFGLYEHVWTRFVRASRFTVSSKECLFVDRVLGDVHNRV